MHVIWLWTISDIWRAPHELFPQKSVPYQIPAGLEYFRKSFIAWTFVQFEKQLFLIMSLIFAKNSANNYFEIDETCLLLSFKWLFARFSRWLGYIQHFNFCKRCSFPVPCWLEKEKKPRWLGKSEHILAKCWCSKTTILMSFINAKCVVGCPSYICLWFQLKIIVKKGVICNIWGNHREHYYYPLLVVRKTSLLSLPIVLRCRNDVVPTLAKTNSWKRQNVPVWGRYI